MRLMMHTLLLIFLNRSGKYEGSIGDLILDF